MAARSPLSPLKTARGHESEAAVARRPPVPPVCAWADEGVTALAEVVKALIRESFHLGGQIVNGTAAVVMHLTLDPGYTARVRQTFQVPASHFGRCARHMCPSRTGVHASV